MRWVAFSYSLPAKSGSSPRVALWRRLRRLGAIAPTASVQVLPERPECVEAFQWLAQEVRRVGGEAVLMHVDAFGSLTDQQLIAMFRAARSEEYAELEAPLGELEKMVLTSLRPEDVPQVSERLAKLRKRHADISKSDYFETPEGVRLAARLGQVTRLLSASFSPAVEVPRVSLSDYRGRKWVTRPRPHVDRLACIWLIRRFIDPSAVVSYRDQPESSEVPFDMEGAEFGHQGSLCSFETMLQAFGLSDPALDALAQIVHDIDLSDSLYARPETPGLDAVLSGWLAAGFSDADLESHGTALYEGLYRELSQALSERQATETTRSRQEASP